MLVRIVSRRRWYPVHMVNSRSMHRALGRTRLIILFQLFRNWVTERILQIGLQFIQRMVRKKKLPSPLMALMTRQSLMTMFRSRWQRMERSQSPKQTFWVPRRMQMGILSLLMKVCRQRMERWRLLMMPPLRVLVPGFLNHRLIIMGLRISVMALLTARWVRGRQL